MKRPLLPRTLRKFQNCLFRFFSSERQAAGEAMPALSRSNHRSYWATQRIKRSRQTSFISMSVSFISLLSFPKHLEFLFSEALLSRTKGTLSASTILVDSLKTLHSCHSRAPRMARPRGTSKRYSFNSNSHSLSTTVMATDMTTVFETVQEAKEFLAAKSVADKKPLRVKKSDPSRLDVVCEIQTCTFKLNVVSGHDGLFHISKSIPHSCNSVTPTLQKS